MSGLHMQLPKLDGNMRWTGDWRPAVRECVAPTLSSLRANSRYWVVSDVQLKRDLKGRTLADVYRENRALRPKLGPYVPRWDTGDLAGGGLDVQPRKRLQAEYLAWCKSRKHTPHPASIDPDHPHNAHRLRAPKRETV